MAPKRKGFWEKGGVLFSSKGQPSFKTELDARRFTAGRREFIYREEGGRFQRYKRRLPTKRGHATLRENEMTIRAFTEEQARVGIERAIKGRNLTYDPSSIRPIHDTELYAFTPVVLKKAR